MESRCAIIFFDELDALGRSRVDEDSGKMSQAGADNSSRRVLAELLIQMTKLSDDGNRENGSESEGEGCDGNCDDCESFCNFDRNDDGVQPSDNSFVNVCTEVQNGGTPRNSGKEVNNIYTPDQMQTKPRIIVIAATNRPEDCDPALLRRFAVRVLVGLPSRKDRKKIIQRLLLDVEHNISSTQLEKLAIATDGWSGSDLESMTREAVMAPVRECLRAAAIMKRMASKVVQRSRVDSSQMHELKRVEDVQNATREALLNNFRKLRPVSADDFEVCRLLHICLSKLIGANVHSFNHRMELHSSWVTQLQVTSGIKASNSTMIVAVLVRMKHEVRSWHVSVSVDYVLPLQSNSGLFSEAYMPKRARSNFPSTELISFGSLSKPDKIKISTNHPVEK